MAYVKKKYRPKEPTNIDQPCRCGTGFYCRRHLCYGVEPTHYADHTVLQHQVKTTYKKKKSSRREHGHDG